MKKAIRFLGNGINFILSGIGLATVGLVAYAILDSRNGTAANKVNSEIYSDNEKAEEVDIPASDPASSETQSVPAENKPPADVQI